MVVTNLITFLSYLTICLTLLYMVRRTGRVIAKDWAYFVVGFALFIVACGSTHLMEVVTTWIPVFWVDAWTNIITAALSAWVAVMLVRRASLISFGINDYAARVANAEIENQQMQERLIGAQKLEDWSRMSAAVSHEIRNPLEAIQNMQYLIETAPGVSTEVAALARATSEEAARVLTISDSALSFIRQARKPEIVDLREAAESVEFLLGAMIRDRGIDYSMEASGDCVVEAYAGEARQVLLNVVRNACEAVAQSRARVRVVITGREDGVQVVVHDEGSGIQPEAMPTLFHFGQSTKGSQGNGMGLWTSKQIMDRHKGTIAVESEPGRGTQFTLWWPRKFPV